MRLFYIAYQWIVIKKKDIYSSSILGSYSKVEYWFHGVSLGEVILISRIIEVLNFKKTTHITTGNSVSYKYLKDKLGNSRGVSISYLPMDDYFVMKRLIEQIYPKYLYIIEQDVWPNMLKICGDMGIKRILLNAYIKPKDYQIFKFFLWVFPYLYHLDKIYVQNEEVLEQFISLGRVNAIEMAGNMKYMKYSTGIKSIKSLDIPSKKVVVLGSIHYKESQKIVQDIDNMKDYSILVIPRHPKDAKIKEMSLYKKWGRVQCYSDLETQKNWDVLIIDQIGISLNIYELADIVIIGDSFLPTEGGHNILEPLFLNKMVIYGPYLKTYKDITGDLEGKGITYRLTTKDIKECINKYFNDDIRKSQIKKEREIFLKNIQMTRKKISKILYL